MFHFLRRQYFHVLFERFVNPAASTLIGLLDNEKRNNLFYLFMIPKLFYWRIRYSAYIDQRFGSYFISYMVNKLLALFGNKASKKIVEDIERSKVLSPGNIFKRIKTNFGVKENETLISRLFQNTKDLLSRETGRIKSGAKHINEGIAPITGTLGAFLVTFAIPIKAITDLLHVETGDKTKIGINFASTFPFLSQQSHYFSRFSIPEFVKFKEIIENLNAPKPEKHMIRHKEEYEELAKERKKSFFTGLTANILGILLPFTKLLGGDGQFVKIFKSLVSELSNIFLLLFLSARRVLEGKSKVLEIKWTERKRAEKNKVKTITTDDNPPIN